MASAVPPGYACRLASPYWVGIRTPFRYPDGDLVEVFACPDPDREGVVLLSDLGEAVRAGSTICAADLSNQYVSAIERIAGEYDVTFRASVLSTTATQANLFGRVQALARVASSPAPD